MMMDDAFLHLSEGSSEGEQEEKEEEQGWITRAGKRASPREEEEEAYAAPPRRPKRARAASVSPTKPRTAPSGEWITRIGHDATRKDGGLANTHFRDDLIKPPRRKRFVKNRCRAATIAYGGEEGEEGKPRYYPHAPAVRDAIYIAKFDEDEGVDLRLDW